MKFSKRSLVMGIIGISLIILGFIANSLLEKLYFYLEPFTRITYSIKDKLIFNIPTLFYLIGLIFTVLSMRYQIKDKSDL